MTDLERAAQAAAEVLRPDVIEMWLQAPNQLLGGDTPEERIANGDLSAVLALIGALAEGVAT